MNIENIEKMWEQDSVIDQTEICNESAKIGKVHHKYSSIMFREKLALEKLQCEFPVLYKDKFELYTGSCSRETLEKRGWQPFQLKILKGEVERYIQADREIIDETLKIAFQREKVEYLKAILGMINSRSYHINNIIAEKKFNAGLN